MAYQFSSELEKQFQWLVSRYPKKDAALIPLLHKVQDEVGHLSTEAIDYVAERMELSPARVREVASFYTMFRFEEQGKYRLNVCHNLSCYLRGCEDLIQKIKDKLGIKEGETTPDGKFTLQRVECLGSCGTAPVMQVNNWDFFEELDVEKLEQVLEMLKADKAAKPSIKERFESGGIA